MKILSCLKKFNLQVNCVLASPSALRASSIQHLNINFVAKTKSCYKFYFNKLHKNWRKGKAPPAVAYQEYTQDESLCVVKTLDEYIARTKRWRSGEESSQLLLSFIHPKKPPIASTLSGWLKTILMKSVVDTIPPDLHQTLKQVYKVLQ